MDFQSGSFCHNRYFIRFETAQQDVYDIRVLLDKKTEFRIGNSSWDIDSRGTRLVFVFLRYPWREPNGGIYVCHNFNLPNGRLYLVPYDPDQSQVTWSWLEKESARNDRTDYLAAHPAANAHVESPWDATAWPAEPHSATLEEVLPEIRAHALGAGAAAAAAAQPTAGARAGRLAEPRAYTPH